MLTLYSTEGCHLCEDAEALLRQVRSQDVSIAWQVVDIAHDDQLFEQYGWLIPVLQRPDSQELRWPFDLNALEGFLA